jgi:hypothetical protein
MTPVPYSIELEQPEPNEHETGVSLREVLHDIMSTTAKDNGHAIRSVHAKGHALLEAKMTVKSGLPAELAQGLFAQPGEYPVVMRISTIPGDLLDDHVSVPRGLAMKVINVEGDRLEGSENAVTQDFVLVNGPAFGAAKGSKFLGTLRLLSKTTDKAEWAKRALSSVLQTVEKGLEALGTESALIKTLGGHPLTNPAGEIYFSQTPFRYGDYIAKFSLAPVSPNLTALRKSPVQMSGHRDGLREALNRVFAHDVSIWEFRVQLLTDISKMPVEDPSVVWPEELSPFIAVATVTALPQAAWDQNRQVVGDDKLAFSPWRGLAAHRPLGSINRLRKAAYQMSADFRANTNRCPIEEPREAVKL